MVQMPYDEAFAAALTRVAPTARWSPSRQGFRVEVGQDYGCARALLAFAAERGIPVDADAAAMLRRHAARQGDTAAAAARAAAAQAAWNTRPARPLDEVRRVVGPVVRRGTFYCLACEGEDSGWATAGDAPVAVRHLPTVGGPQRITDTECALLLAALDIPAPAAATAVYPPPVGSPRATPQRAGRWARRLLRAG